MRIKMLKIIPKHRTTATPPRGVPLFLPPYILTLIQVSKLLCGDREVSPRNPTGVRFEKNRSRLRWKPWGLWRFSQSWKWKKEQAQGRPKEQALFRMFVGNLEAMQKNLWLRKARSNPSKLQIDFLHVLSSPWRTKTTNFLNKNFWTTKTKENAPPSSQGSHGNYQPKQCNSLLFSGKIPRKFAIDSCIKFHSPSQTKKRGSQFKFFPCRLTGHPPLISILSKSSASRAPLAMRDSDSVSCPRPFFFRWNDGKIIWQLAYTPED